MFPKSVHDDPEWAVRLVDQTLADARSRGASDVHFDPVGQRWDIRCRVDGVLGPARGVPRSPVTDPVTRLLAMAGLPTYQTSRPAEGLIRLGDGGNREELRLAVFPTINGPRAVVRRSGRGSGGPRGDLDSLGLPTDVTAALRQACSRPGGLVLVVGPAGSGKTTTLHACLREIVADQTTRRPTSGRPTSGRSVLSVEDPVEATIDGVGQSQVTERWSLAQAFRAAMRQDADVLMASEIRDGETAAAVVDAAMTGHLTFASSHASSVGGALTRLVRAGVPAAAVADALVAVCQVRLLRVRCPPCHNGSKKADCEICGGSGYRGRRPIAAVLLADREPGPAVMDVLVNQGSATAIDAVAGRGLERAADDAVEQGWTDRAEVRRILGDGARCGGQS